MSAHRVLGVAQGASQRQIKEAFRMAAKEWHPDVHQGAAKKLAEERFKQIQQAYQALQDGAGGSDSRHTAAPARHRPSSSARDAHWGSQQAGRPGYDPFRTSGYTTSRAYDSAAQAATQRVEDRRTRTWLGCLAAFGVGLGVIVLTSKQNHEARESGQSVDAYYNQATRRWEPATKAMMRDPLLSTMVHLKPKEDVHQPTRASQRARLKSVTSQTRTLDGRKPADAFKSRQAGSRHGP